MALRHFMLFTTSAMALLPAAVSAQQAAPAPDPQGEIVVTGIRASLRNAINVKKQANAVVDVITSEDIGKFPDRNVAESLSHIPGVSIDRRFGEGEKVAIHGTDPALNRMLLDGHAVASADWGGNDNDPTSRTFNYSLLAPELVERLEVYKSPEPRIDEGSIGGTVIVRTRRPLETPANSVFASGGYSWNDRAEKGNIRASGLYSWKNQDETFGILAAVTYDKQNLTRAGVEFFGFENAGSRFFNTAADGSFTLKNPNATVTGGTLADLYNAKSPFGINYAYFTQQRKRISYSGTMQFKPTDSLTLTLTGLRIDGNYNNSSQSMYVIPGAWSGDVLQSATVNDGVVTAASFGAASANSQSSQLDLLVRKTKLTTNNLNLEAEWKSDSGASFTATGGWSRAVGGRNPEYLLDVRTDLPYSYSFTPNSAEVNYDGDLTDPANYRRSNSAQAQTIDGQPIIYNGTQLVAARAGGIDFSRTIDRDYYAGYDAVIPVAFGPFTEVRIGGKYTKHRNRLNAAGFNNYDLSGGYTLASLGVDTITTPNGAFDGTGGTGNATQYINLPAQAVIDILANSVNIAVDKPTASYIVDEEVAANYVQFNFEQGGFRGNIGGRLVYTKNSSAFTAQVAQGDGALPVLVPGRVNNDYLKFLPSFNIAYDTGSNVILRGSVAKVIARPRYEQLGGSIGRNDITLDASGGNPNLKPYQSTNYELSAEWYPKAGMLFSLELFRREVKDYIYNGITQQTFFNELLQQNQVYNVSQPINGGKATVNGVLVSGQAEIWGGFGIQANYSFADSSTDEGLNLPYLSKHTVNIIPYFESGPFQARLSYNYRSAYFRAIGRLNSVDMVAPYNQLDFSASYAITPNITLTANAQNLLDETYIQYAGTRATPTAFYKNGRTYAGSVSVRF
ncbi:TonB-dependent receptor [Sphingobium terrigena]|uniref:TonB-dependent receptor n=2 Tax=Sphingobium terrigena TaxID=2304063 RepID=A0A418YVD5_9SPHN|nr:TonB-dependent receptor [Sphingobium terrigena]